MAFETAAQIEREGVDLIICDMITYATSSVFAPIIQNIMAPVILLALQPLTHMDYSSASTRMQLENDSICAVPEFTCVEDVVKEYNKVTEEEIEQKKSLILAEFETPTPLSDPLTMKLTDADLEKAAKGAAALDRLIDTFSLDGFHGKPGSGASVEFKIKEGPITMLGITQNAKGGFKFVIGEGYSKKGPIPPTGKKIGDILGIECVIVK